MIQNRKLQEHFSLKNVFLVLVCYYEHITKQIDKVGHFDLKLFIDVWFVLIRFKFCNEQIHCKQCQRVFL